MASRVNPIATYHPKGRLLSSKLALLGRETGSHSYSMGLSPPSYQRIRGNDIRGAGCKAKNSHCGSSSEAVQINRDGVIGHYALTGQHLLRMQ